MSSEKEFLAALTEADEELQKLGFRRIGIEMPHAVYATYRSGLYCLRLMYGPPEFHVEFALDYDNREVMMEMLFQKPEVAKYIGGLPQPLAHIETSLKDEVFFFVNVLKAARPYLTSVNLRTRERPVIRK